MVGVESDGTDQGIRDTHSFGTVELVPPSIIFPIIIDSRLDFHLFRDYTGYGSWWVCIQGFRPGVVAQGRAGRRRSGIIALMTVVMLAGGCVYGFESQAIPIGGFGPAGGYVCYDKGSSSDGWRYLEVAPDGWSGKAEDPEYIFGYYRKSSTGTSRVVGTGTKIGSGKANTAILVAAMGGMAYSTSRDGDKKAVYAAKACADCHAGGFHDWFLPSEDELNLVLVNLKLQGIGTFSDERYWSSTEYDNLNAMCQFFDDDGEAWECYRDNGFRVRPMRAF